MVLLSTSRLFNRVEAKKGSLSWKLVKFACRQSIFCSRGLHSELEPQKIVTSELKTMVSWYKVFDIVIEEKVF